MGLSCSQAQDIPHNDSGFERTSSVSDNVKPVTGARTDVNDSAIRLLEFDEQEHLTLPC